MLERALDKLRSYAAFANTRRGWSWLAGIILVLAFLLRVWGLNAESIWIDEAYSIRLAQYSLQDILVGTAADQHPPLYYLLLHFWLYLGSGVTHARLLSVLLGVINIAQVLHLGRRLGSPVFGLLASVLLAVHPMHIWYSQEVRMYILLAALATAATSQLWDNLDNIGSVKWKGWGLYSLFCLLALYTHYFSAFVLLAHGVIMLWWTWGHHRTRPVVSWAAALLVTALGFGPWTPIALDQTLHHTMPWIPPPSLEQVNDTLLRLMLGSLVFAIPAMLRWLVGAAALVGIAIVIWTFRFRLRQDHALVFCVLGAVIPLLAITGVSLWYPIFQFKQFIIVLTPLFLSMALLTGGGLSAVPSREVLSIEKPQQTLIKDTGILLLGGILFTSLIVSSLYQGWVGTKDDWRQVAGLLARDNAPGDIIYANPAAARFALDLYWQTPLPVLGYPPDYDILKGSWANPQVTRVLADHELGPLTQGARSFWLVEYFPEFWDPDMVIPGWLGERFPLEQDLSIGQIHLRQYRIEALRP